MALVSFHFPGLLTRKINTSLVSFSIHLFCLSYCSSLFALLYVSSVVEASISTPEHMMHIP